MWRHAPISPMQRRKLQALKIAVLVVLLPVSLVMLARAFAS
jgi:hypothetical protein